MGLSIQNLILITRENSKLNGNVRSSEQEILWQMVRGCRDRLVSWHYVETGLLCPFLRRKFTFIEININRYRFKHLQIKQLIFNYWYKIQLPYHPLFFFGMGRWFYWEEFISIFCWDLYFSEPQPQELFLTIKTCLKIVPLMICTHVVSLLFSFQFSFICFSALPKTFCLPLITSTLSQICWDKSP